jgi:hypothetical protein
MCCRCVVSAILNQFYCLVCLTVHNTSGLCLLPQELQLAAAHGVSQDRIIFANPCKRPADFRCAWTFLLPCGTLT